MEFIGWILGRLFSLSYHLAGSNYLLAVVVFTLFTKIILLPVSVWTQYNGIRMVKMQPLINEIKAKYYGDKEAVSEGIMALYKSEKYNAFVGTIPMIIQIIMLLGIIQVVRHPETAGLADRSMTLGKIHFYEYPSVSGGLYWMMPVWAGLSAFLLCMAQNRFSPVQAGQTKAGKYGTMAVSVGISLFLGAYVPAAVGVYWIVSNLMTIFQQILLNHMIDPWKYADQERLSASRKRLQELEQVGGSSEKAKRREYAKREKRDYKRFFSVVNKHLVFYSEKNGFYKYFEAVIEYILENSSLTIHYVTSDPEDDIFRMEKENPRIRGYYIGENKLITLFMKMDADMVVMTMTDLDNFHYKRSYVRKDIEYVYLFHAAVSTHMIYHQGAFDHYDTLLCVGEFMFPEIRKQEELYSLPPKKLVACGYGLMEKLKKSYDEMQPGEHAGRKVLIAPSWHENNILDLCLDRLLDELLGKGWEITVRPHPEYVKRYRARLDGIVRKYAGRQGDGLIFELDFTSNTSVFASDILVTDWSGISLEYAFVTGKPVAFIDTPPKIYNPEYEKIGIAPVEAALRDQIGIRFDPAQLSGLHEKFLDILSNQKEYKERNFKLRDQYIANFGHSGEAGGDYIIKSIRDKISRKKRSI